MALVPAKCTQCGGNIEVNDTHEAGICKFCGTPFITEKVIKNYNTFVTNNFAGVTVNVVSADFNNLMDLTEKSINANNGKEALYYVNKALETNPQSGLAWYYKMIIVDLTRTPSEPCIEQTIEYGNNAIEYAVDKNKMEAAVYRHYINSAYRLLSMVISIVEDTDNVKRLASKNYERAEQIDKPIRIQYMRLAKNVNRLKYEVPDEFIASDVSVQNDVVSLARLYVKYHKKDLERLAIYGRRLLNTENRVYDLHCIKEGLPESRASEISDDSVKINNSYCYIATCVYGSYDCPEVWTLRRYRDYTLDETWYGRLFIKCYYAVSPKLVKWFGKYEWFRKPWKKFLDSMVERLNAEGIADTKYSDKY